MHPVPCRCHSTVSSNDGRPASADVVRVCDRAGRLVHPWENVANGSARAVRQSGSSNDLAIGRLEHNGDVLPFGKSLVDL
jgi:hypothetical protein